MQRQSRLMSLFRSLGFEGVAWSLRRLYCPVPREALVLEVGSGGNPYYRSNVLLDAYEESRARHWVPLVSDRPTVLGFAEQLPFKDKCFDFVIASHVLEHSSDPEKFLSELTRVARAGYIEVPEALFERLNPYHDHRLEITVRNDHLVIRKKHAWTEDPVVADLYSHAARHLISRYLIPKKPFEFHVRHFWKGKIDYEIINPEVDASWTSPPSKSDAHPPRIGLKARLKGVVLKVARHVFSQRRRNRGLSLASLLECVSCKSSVSMRPSNGAQRLICDGCKREYPVKLGIPLMFN